MLRFKAKNTKHILFSVFVVETSTSQIPTIDPAPDNPEQGS